MAKMKNWQVTYEYKVTRTVLVDAETRLNAVRAAEDEYSHELQDVAFAMQKDDFADGVCKIVGIRVAHVDKNGEAE